MIPFCKPSITAAEIEAVTATVNSGWLTMGQNVRSLEEEFGTFCQMPAGIAVDSCTSALFLSMKILGVGPGKVVACSPITFAASANMIEALGAETVFVDVDENGLMDPWSPKLRRVDYILAVHYAGQAVDVTTLYQWGKDIIEDAAEAHGAMYPDAGMVGQSGNLTCFSFYPTKIIAGAEGGMIIGATDSQQDELKSLRLHGLSSGAEHRYTDRSSASFPVVEQIGYKMNMTDVSAAIIRTQLVRYEELVAKRRAIVQRYDERLSGIVTRPNHSNNKVAPYLYVILVEDRPTFLTKMLARGIKCGVHFAPLHQQPYYQQKYGRISLPMAEWFGARCVSLPLYPDLTMAEVDEVCQAVKEIIC